jgi:hypothetical protein
MIREFVLASALLLVVTLARADELEPVLLPAPAKPIDQLIYKGVTGNLLESLDMDAEERVTLQRANAVISSPLSARSLGLLLGISNPVFLVGGLVWGLWAAANIEAPKADTRWLGTWRGHRVGFCGRQGEKSCQLEFPVETAEPEQPVDRTVMLEGD